MKGLEWRGGAIGNAEWAGAKLCDVLKVKLMDSRYFSILAATPQEALITHSHPITPSYYATYYSFKLRSLKNLYKVVI